MSKLTASLVLCLPLAAGQPGEVPRHVLGASQPLTAASAAPARAVAQDYARALALSHGLAPEDLAGLYVVKEYRTQHNGVTHLVFRQQFQGVDVYNAEWTVNVDSDGRVLNAGGALSRRPAEDLAAPVSASAPAARRAAARAVRSRSAEQIGGRPVWYRVNGLLRPAWVFSIWDENGIDRYATVVDDVTQEVLGKTNLTLYQSAPRGLVFERSSPQPNPAPGARLSAPPPYVERTLQPFAGDPKASPRGWVSGTATVGNNVVAAHNPLGIVFLENPIPAVSLSRDFSFPLELGPGAPNPMRFKDAVTANLFYWSNRAHDLFYELGFDEAAGNFQQDNYGCGGAGGDPMIAFSQFGAAGASSAALNNAFFTTTWYGDDGAPVSINMYLGVAGQEGVFSDGSLDAAVILHEYTHGVSSRLVRQNYDYYQGGAMGEGWSDFFSLEFTVPEGAPPDGSYPEGEYLFQLFGTGIRTRPYSTNLEIDPLTFKSLGRVRNAPEVHADGEIWMEALWEMRGNLIGQFGEREGRRRARLLAIDGMKLSPPAPTMVDMRDAILLADRVDFGGASQPQIWAAFAKRGLGVLAQSADADSIHILASFETPSPVASMRFYEDRYVLGETVRLVLQDANSTLPAVEVQVVSSSGDLETLLLRRTGSAYAGYIPMTGSYLVSSMDGALEAIPWDFITAYYVDPDAGGAYRLIETSVQVHPGYYAATSASAPPFVSADERALFTPPSGGRTTGLSTRVTLPFAFPFFGNTYTAAWVYGDGLLAFDLPKYAPCSDGASLALTDGIAPMWMDLAYGGTAQKNENVYMSTGPGPVTFRWVAETTALSALSRPSPVSFSATLFEDGRIQLRYGEGNKSLLNSASLAASRGCPVSGPTVGISNGHETYIHTPSSHNGRPDLENAYVLTFEPPFGNSSLPVGLVESPAAGQRYPGVLTVRGIAYDETAAIARLDVLIDRVARARASVNVSRADFCATQKVPGCPLVGFSAVLNLTSLGLAPGQHALQIRATNSRGGFTDFPAEPVAFFLDPEEPRPATGALEDIRDGAELSGSVDLKGYAYVKDLRVLGVAVMLDGVTYGSATYGQRRDDVCGPLDQKPPNCPNVGFTYRLNTRSTSLPLPNGRHALQIRVRDQAERYTLIPETPLTVVVNNPVNQLPQGVLVTPRPNEKLSGKVRITGYAWDPDGKVSAASLYIDGSSYTALRYGLARPEECAQLTGVSACPNIGFEGELDTRELANGPHVLGVRILDSSGLVVFVPALVRYGMNVFIEN